MSSWNYCDRDSRDSYSISTCIFRELRGCKDMVSKFICNKHASYFGVTYRRVALVNGNNDTWTETLMYIVSSENFRVPLFLNSDGNMDLGELETYCQTIKTAHSEVNLEKLKHTIGCLLGVSVNATNSCGGIGGWIDNDASRIIAEYRDAPVEIKSLSLFHKTLLYYAKPAFAGEDIVRVPNIVLRDDPTMTNTVDGTNTLYFMIAEKSALLKHTGESDSVATPLVLLAYAVTNSNNGLSIIYGHNPSC